MDSLRFSGEVARAVRVLQPQGLRITHPGEWRVRDMVDTWEGDLGVPVRIYPDEHFTASLEEFSAWSPLDEGFHEQQNFGRIGFVRSTSAAELLEKDAVTRAGEQIRGRHTADADGVLIRIREAGTSLPAGADVLAAARTQLTRPQ